MPTEELINTGVPQLTPSLCKWYTHTWKLTERCSKNFNLTPHKKRQRKTIKISREVINGRHLSVNLTGIDNSDLSELY